MQIVETTLRPHRIVLVFSTTASSRVVRRAFRLAGGRWGGGFDILLCVDRTRKLTELQSRLLSLADADFLLIVDPRLAEYPWDRELDRARWQPFAWGRLRERAERNVFSWLFIERLTLATGEERPPEVLDVDYSGVTWRRIAINGLPFSNAVVNRVTSRDRETLTPYRRSLAHLSPPGGEGRWVFFGAFDDPALAATYWSIRALGGRPLWRPEGELSAPQPPQAVVQEQRLTLYAPAANPNDVDSAASRWTSSGRTVAAAPSDPSPVLPRRPEPYFVRQTVPVPVHRGRLRLSTPAARALREPLPTFISGTASFRVRSPDPGDPDGMILSRNDRSLELVTEGATGIRRVTRDGLAEMVNLATPQLVQVPLVPYQDAVAAPFESVGLNVGASDKGQYQQLALERAGGLLYLAWLLRQLQSQLVLDLFFESPDGSKKPTQYRRAVRYDEMRNRVYSTLRSPSGRLGSSRRAAADAWLRTWSERLLERELLLGGYLLDCPRCRARNWYRAATVDQRHTCARCGEATVVPADAIRTFRLNEAFYMMRDQEGQVVTLALAALRKRARESFLYLAETVIGDETSPREVDIAALIDGELVLVEAKSNNQLKKREVEKYKYLARVASAERVIFATATKADALCSEAQCDECVEAHSSTHADRAWDTGAQALISEARTSLGGDGIAVETWCYHHLVAQHPTAALDRFARRPAVEPAGFPR